MSYTFHLPDIGEGIAEAEIVRWLVGPGDQVVEDQPIAEIETDKALVEMPSPATGQVAELCAPEGAMVRVGERLIVIADGAAPTPAEPAQSSDSGAGAPPAGSSNHTPQSAHGSGAQKRPLATPATRRLARELGASIQTLVGTGPGGRISDNDVRAAVHGASQEKSAPTSPATAVAAERSLPESGSHQPVGLTEDQRIPVRGLRRRTAEAMVRALRDIPHTVAMHHADVGDLLALRKSLLPGAEAKGIGLTLTPFLVKATALALVQFPMANASFDDAAQEIIVRARRNVGFAVNTPDGLVIPVVKDADRKPLLAIAREVEALTAAARTRTVAIEQMQEGTFTISNHGPLGGNFGTPIIRAPEGGILGFGRATPQAVVRDGDIVARTLLPISYSADHRLVDGDVVIGFCQALITLLEAPVQLLVEEG
ncbi:dihydrolipoamide acetyltransferase family protein [Rhodococcus jostii]|uniref:Dihydrolipoamide acetyltransferase component of pyruvate dehydrogenase complex n=1 Tax=Rhodococcus jostii TaxID=132919 RepID=A0A1H4XBS1_RHOJO|nr:dihydrolipoamide acetyltransferase family protein [Rhodococcus jostii]SED03192.1 pyruvate dehydrogenase E2 component (dihydrolipoamide acetyltransferase) [Rhodococcus jostii]